MGVAKVTARCPFGEAERTFRERSESGLADQESDALPNCLNPYQRHLFLMSLYLPMPTVATPVAGVPRVGGGSVQPGSIRPVEYEIVPSHQAASLGVTGSRLRDDLGAPPQIGVLRCVDHQSRKLTVVGDARYVRRLIASGQASNPDGLDLNRELFPVVMTGWKSSAAIAWPTALVSVPIAAPHLRPALEELLPIAPAVVDSGLSALRDRRQTQAPTNQCGRSGSTTAP
jgi:hypothetical protein